MRTNEYPTKLVQCDSLEEIDAWVAAGGQTSEMVRMVMARVNWPNLPLIETWLHRAESRRQDEHFRLQERSTGAAEQSARHARTSAWCAAIAIGISLVALAAAVFPLLKP